MEIRVHLRGLSLSKVEERRIRSQLARLERRLVHRPEPMATLVLTRHSGQRLVASDLRVELGPAGTTLVSHQHHETPDRAAHLAVDDITRQLERHTAGQRGDASFGVPSRRLPKALRPERPAPSTITLLDEPLDEKPAE